MQNPRSSIIITPKRNLKQRYKAGNFIEKWIKLTQDGFESKSTSM
eukprot:UN34554